MLVMDRYYPHTRNLKVITLTRENQTDIICPPPHGTHQMRSLNKTLVGPLKIFYCQEIKKKKLCRDSGRVATFYKTDETIWNFTQASLQQARQGLMDSGRQAQALVTGKTSGYTIFFWLQRTQMFLL